MRWGIGLWIACLWACNPINGVKISGNLLHYKGNKLYFEVCGQDTTIAVALDSTGAFEADLPLVKAGYVRLANGKAAFPLFRAGQILVSSSSPYFALNSPKVPLSRASRIFSISVL